MRPCLIALLVPLAVLSCVAEPSVSPQSPPLQPPEPPSQSSPTTVATPPSERPPLVFVSDDIPAAMSKARAEGKALFVDGWAPWCHTCLSMKHFVLNDPSLRPLADRVIFADIDTDKPENAAFMERHPMRVWPTFFVIDPASDKVIGYWTGSASVKELRDMLGDALRERDDRIDAERPKDHPNRLLVEAKRAQAAGDYAAATQSYRQALDKGGNGWVRRSEALASLLLTLYAKKDHEACAELGKKHAHEVQGAALPADFASLTLACAAKLPAGDMQKETRDVALSRLKDVVKNPHPDATADDRADAYGLLAEGLKEVGDEAGAKTANEMKLTILEQAAKAAPTPEAAASYDYGRAMAYLALGRGQEAIAMLTEREAHLPKSYEPPARLAQVLYAMGQWEPALGAINRAIERAYGPRRLQYMKRKGDIQAKLGDPSGQLATLREEVAGYEALDKGQANPVGLQDAKNRLAEAEKAVQKAGRKSVRGRQ